MALFSEVKCRRCDRRYSGLRGRCPYCGTRRSGKGKRVPSEDNTTVKVIIGLLLLFILAAAVVCLIVMSKQSAEPKEPKTPEAVYTADEGVTSMETAALPSQEPSAAPSVAPSVAPSKVVDSVTVSCYGSELSASNAEGYTYEFSMSTGETVPLDVSVTPEGDHELKWSSEDESSVIVLENGDVTAISSGNVGVVLTVDGSTTVKCLVRVN